MLYRTDMKRIWILVFVVTGLPLSSTVVSAGAPRVLGDASGAPSPLPEGNRGIAGRYPEDQGLANDGTVLFHDDFERGFPTDRWDMLYQQPNIRLVEEPQHVYGGQRSLELTVPQQPREVSNELVKRLGDGHDTVFLRYLSKFDAGFDQVGSSHNGGFLAAIAPDGRSLPRACEPMDGTSSTPASRTGAASKRRFHRGS